MDNECTCDDCAEDIQTGFNMSCAFCMAFVPIMVKADPDTGEGLGLFGQCNARHNVGACPAGKMRGVKVSIKIFQRSAHIVDEDGRAVAFTDERTREEV